jgi:hypothetical protein
MIGALDLFVRTVKRYYEESGNILTGGKQGIDTFLFGTDDLDTAATFTLDRLVSNPHSVTFRHRDEESHVRPYEAGTGTIITIPHASDKTPISETLRDSVVAGIESTAGISVHDAKLMADVVRQHIGGWLAARWKLAIETIRTGIFTARGINGEDIGLDINFARLGSKSITYDFTAVGASIDQALLNLYDAYRAGGSTPSGIVIIAGLNWISAFQNDANVIERAKANTANVLVTQSLMPPSLLNTEGLYLVANYLIPGTLTPVFICGYQPQFDFVGAKGSAPVPFMPVDDAIIFSTVDSVSRFRVFRGVDAFDTGGNVIRTVGEIVFDGFKTNDPIEELIRSQSRFAFIAGNINRTAVCTGTFPAAS